jgi:hypothetical protein
MTVDEKIAGLLEVVALLVLDVRQRTGSKTAYQAETRLETLKQRLSESTAGRRTRRP